MKTNSNDEYVTVMFVFDYLFIVARCNVNVE